MDNNLQEQLQLLKIGYIKKLEGMISEFRVLLEKIDLSVIDELYPKVHTISGTSGMYGLMELSDISTTFELYLIKIKNDATCYDGKELKTQLIGYVNIIEHIIKGEIDG